MPRLIAMREGLAWDELYLYSLVHDQGLGAMLDAVRATEKTPPLGFVTAWLPDRLGGPPQLIRLPALIAGLSLVPLTALLARRAFGSTAGLAAAALAAASPFLLFYSVEARSYSLTAALALGSTLLLLRALDNASKRDWVAYSLLGAAALMSHYTAVSVLAVQFGWALATRPDRRRAALLAQAAPLLATLAWLPSMADQVRNSSDELARLSAAAPLSLDTLGRLIGRTLVGNPFVALDRVPGSAALVAIAIGATIAAGFALARFVEWSRLDERPKPKAETMLLVLIAVAPLALALLVSLQPKQSMLLPRNVLVGLPAALALVSALLVRPPRPAAAAACALVIGGLAVGSAVALTEGRRPASREAALAVSSRWKPGDRILDLCCIAGARGPLGTAVAINLPEDRRAALSIVTLRGNGIYDEVLRERGRLFVIGSRIEGNKDLILFSPPKGWPDAYRPVWSKRWPGVVETEAIEYVPR
ncbi:MAG: glycosyltransferase family 39 protein [Actinomycetes bacterium]